jgi:hypothetical protein
VCIDNRSVMGGDPAASSCGARAPRACWPVSWRRRSASSRLARGGATARRTRFAAGRTPSRAG